MTKLTFTLGCLPKYWVKFATVGLVVGASSLGLPADGIAQSGDPTGKQVQLGQINNTQSPLITGDVNEAGDTDPFGLVDAGFSEAFGTFEQGSPATDVIAVLGISQSKDKKQFWGGAPDFRYIQTWSYPRQGITLHMVSDTQDGPQRIYGMTIKSPLQLQTKLGLKIGDSKQKVLELYGEDGMCGPRIIELWSHGICGSKNIEEGKAFLVPIHVSEDLEGGGSAEYYGGFFIWIDQGHVKEMSMWGGVG